MDQRDRLDKDSVSDTQEPGTVPGAPGYGKLDSAEWEFAAFQSLCDVRTGVRTLDEVLRDEASKTPDWLRQAWEVVEAMEAGQMVELTGGELQRVYTALAIVRRRLRSCLRRSDSPAIESDLRKVSRVRSTLRHLLGDTKGSRP